MLELIHRIVKLFSPRTTRCTEFRLGFPESLASISCTGAVLCVRSCVQNIGVILPVLCPTLKRLRHFFSNEPIVVLKIDQAKNMKRHKPVMNIKEDELHGT